MTQINFEALSWKGLGKAGSGRRGEPDEFGVTCAFLCSQKAGYITSQNVLMDGGLYPGTF